MKNFQAKLSKAAGLVLLACGLAFFASCEKEVDDEALERASEVAVDEFVVEEAEGAGAGDFEDGEIEFAADLEEGETRHFGAPFTIDGEPMTLAAALAGLADGEKAGGGVDSGVDGGTAAEGIYKVEATVEKVCQKKGCWFTLAADDVEIPVRVQMKDYAFFVARNSQGARVVLEGTLNKVDTPRELAQHFADDEVKGTGKQAEQIEADQPTYRFMVTGVELSRPAA